MYVYGVSAKRAVKPSHEGLVWCVAYTDYQFEYIQFVRFHDKQIADGGMHTFCVDEDYVCLSVVNEM